MRHLGLTVVVALGVTAAGTAVGWLAVAVEGRDFQPPAAAARPAAGHATPEAGDLQRPVAVADADVDPLHLAGDHTRSLESELARLRWRVADLRRDCRPEHGQVAQPAAIAAPDRAASDRGPTEMPTTVALGGPRSLITNPERDEMPPARAETVPAVPPPPMAPPRERAPVRLAAADPTPPPIAPPPIAQPRPPPMAAQPPALPHQPGQELAVPEAAMRSGDLGFLDGCWLSEQFNNPVNGNTSTKVYCFDAGGNGQMNFRGVDGTTCSAAVRARWEPGRTLVLEEPQDGSCGAVGLWHREITNCAIGGDGRARCNSYEFYRQFSYATRMTRI